MLKGTSVLANTFSTWVINSSNLDSNSQFDINYVNSFNNRWCNIITRQFINVYNCNTVLD